VEAAQLTAKHQAQAVRVAGEMLALLGVALELMEPPISAAGVGVQAVTQQMLAAQAALES
jgi:hypothetical protein